jgi:hypothetical protein
MEFKIFENKVYYLEYLQIYCYYQLIVNDKPDMDIEAYPAFELTDTIIDSFNQWVKMGKYVNSKALEWLEANPDRIEYFKRNFPGKFKPKVSVWSDRKKTAYYKGKLQDSFLFENYIADLLERNYGLEIGQYMTPKGQYELGENALGIEIKNDTLIEKYGNVYIEYQEKSSAGNNDYVNSGILKDDLCEYFLIGTRKKFYIFKKSRLIRIYKEEIRNRRMGISSPRSIQFKQIATSKGYVYPVRNAKSDTITLDEMVAEIKKEKG